MATITVTDQYRGTVIARGGVLAGVRMTVPSYSTGGELRAVIASLPARQWRHPGTGEPVSFGFSTIERWYYRALQERTDPVGKRAASGASTPGTIGPPR
jgi:hypothetical protein